MFELLLYIKAVESSIRLHILIRRVYEFHVKLYAFYRLGRLSRAHGNKRITAYRPMCDAAGCGLVAVRLLIDMAAD